MTQSTEPNPPLPANFLRMRTDAELAPDQVNELRRQLERRRAELLREHAEHIDVRFAPGDTVSEAEEDAARTNEQETLLELAEAERGLLTLIERALRKVADGTYGVSEESGEPIGYERLRAVPWARFTAPEQEQLERDARRR